MINKINSQNTTSKNSTVNYTPKGIGQHTSRHGFNGEMGIKNSVNTYILGNGNRIYMGNLGVFNQKDKVNILKGGGINPYSYSNQDPINNHDPSGNSALGFHLGNTIGVVGAITSIVLAVPTGGASLTVTGGITIALAGAEGLASSASMVLYLTDNASAAGIAGWTGAATGIAALGVSGLGTLSAKLTSSASTISRPATNISPSVGTISARSSRASRVSSINLASNAHTPVSSVIPSSLSRSRFSSISIASDLEIVKSDRVSSISGISGSSRRSSISFSSFIEDLTNETGNISDASAISSADTVISKTSSNSVINRGVQSEISASSSDFSFQEIEEAVSFPKIVGGVPKVVPKENITTPIQIEDFIYDDSFEFNPHYKAIYSLGVRGGRGSNRINRRGLFRSSCIEDLSESIV